MKNVYTLHVQYMYDDVFMLTSSVKHMLNCLQCLYFIPYKYLL